ncbi:hypothetical protein M8J76_007129 [Diaphorina citri]|nr:hypothetical protein M8J76_007129 [Diaphorina citri]
MTLRDLFIVLLVLCLLICLTIICCAICFYHTRNETCIELHVLKREPKEKEVCKRMIVEPCGEICCV